MKSTSDIRVTTIPAIRYTDPDRAIEWLKTALGFTEKVVYRNTAGIVEHAELAFGNGMVMIGTAGRNEQTAHWFVQPHSVGAVTASVYLIVADCGPAWVSAKGAGAEILQEMETKS
ncbi:VOC family protein [Granulicella arctica]|uniref:glyoxalase n=1 Tax=Granulicella arctica TaxID=940613 RepID=UPI0021E0BECE|nr:glyoxalase [Granulicella arctica]